jgi:hypothetical protein
MALQVTNTFPPMAPTWSPHDLPTWVDTPETIPARIDADRPAFWGNSGGTLCKRGCLREVSTSRDSLSPLVPLINQGRYSVTMNTHSLTFGILPLAFRNAAPFLLSIPRLPFSSCGSHNCPADQCKCPRGKGTSKVIPPSLFA